MITTEQPNADQILLTIEQTAKLLNMSKNRVYELTKKKGFPIFMNGKKYLIPRKQLEAWIDKNIAI